MTGTSRNPRYDNLADELMSRLLASPGVEERKSRWQDSDALWYQGKEFLHFERADLVDIRLGRKVIKANRDRLDDPRIMSRGQSDWINVKLSSDDDAQFLVELIEELIIPRTRS